MKSPSIKIIDDIEYVTVRHMAERSGVKEKTIYAWLWREVLPSRKFAGNVLVRKEDFDKYLKGDD